MAAVSYIMVTDYCQFDKNNYFYRWSATISSDPPEGWWEQSGLQQLYIVS